MLTKPLSIKWRLYNIMLYVFPMSICDLSKCEKLHILFYFEGDPKYTTPIHVFIQEE